MKRILQVTNYMDRGGIETLLMNLYRTIDRTEFQFDFLTHPHDVDVVYAYEEEIKELGGKVYKAPSFVKDPVAYKRFIVSFFAEHPEYRIVHAHNLDSAALAYMPIVKKHGCYLIAHAHNDNERGSLLRRSLINLTHRIIRRYPDYFYACSDEAGTFFFGKKIAKSDNFAIFNNAILLDKYSTTEDEHVRCKKKLFHGTNGPIFGTVGRLCEQKNHGFLLDVFAKIHAKNEDAVLAIVGEGELRRNLESKAHELEIEGSVRFVGSVGNVDEYLKAFDVFLFPSLYEGLGMAAVEAQAAGLPTLLSDSIPSKAMCTDLAKPISLSKDSEIWAECALDSYKANLGHRTDRVQQVRRSGFDIKQVTKELCDFYSSHYPVLPENRL